MSDDHDFDRITMGRRSIDPYSHGLGAPFGEITEFVSAERVSAAAAAGGRM